MRIEARFRLDRGAFRLDVDLDLASSGLVALYGPSGSGKTTLLRCIAGLEIAPGGRLVVDGEIWQDDRVLLPTHRRPIGYVFQESSLFAHLTVEDNLLYGWKRLPPAERTQSFGHLYRLLGISRLLSRSPATLSGGERQRIAIGRALLASPRVLLMDEPLASLDANRKLEILPYIERLRDELKIPIVYVSHAVEEVARLAQTVVRLNDGKVAAVGPPSHVLTPTALARAAERFDAISLLTGKVTRIDTNYGVTVLDHPAGQIVLPWQVSEAQHSVQVAVRATNVTLSVGRPGNVSIRTALKGKVLGIEMDQGPFALVRVELAGGDVIYAYATRLAIEELGLDAGDDVFALLKTVAIDERGVSGLSIPGQET